MKKSLVTTGLALAIVLAATALPAQVDPAPYITVHYDRIDPAHAEAWIENNKAWVKAFQEAKAGEEFYWRGYQSGFTYAWVSDMPNYAFMDDNEAREKALNEKLGEGKMDELMAGGSGAILEHHNEIWKYQADMSYIPEGFSPAGMNSINVSIDRIKPSMGKEFGELLKDVVAAMKKIEAPINWFAYHIPFGEGDYAFVSWAEDRAALHGGPDFGELLTEALGQEGSKEIFSRYLKCASTSEERDWKVRPDLSYVSDDATHEKAGEEATE
jgi:hypothetical protein